jgi:hypothetical protein
MVRVCRKKRVQYRNVPPHSDEYVNRTRVIPVHTIKANKYAAQRHGSAHSSSGCYTEVSGQFQIPAALLAGKNHGTHCIAGCVGTRSGLEQNPLGRLNQSRRG